MASSAHVCFSDQMHGTHNEVNVSMIGIELRQTKLCDVPFLFLKNLFCFSFSSFNPKHVHKAAAGIYTVPFLSIQFPAEASRSQFLILIDTWIQ